MNGGRFSKRLTEARRRVKSRLYAEVAALARCDPVAGQQARALNLFKRLTDLEQADGPGSLERLLAGLPGDLARQICEALRRLLDERGVPAGRD
jgi:hypothetical protein